MEIFSLLSGSFLLSSCCGLDFAEQKLQSVGLKPEEFCMNSPIFQEYEELVLARAF